MKDAEIDDNNNKSVEKDLEKKEEVGIKFTEQKPNLENDENAIDFRWPDIQGEYDEDIAKANLIESLQKQADKEIFFQKNYWRIAWLLRYHT